MGDLVNIFISSKGFLSVTIGIFWMLLFLQSGIDKIVDWKGNISWLSGHFKDSILSSMVKPLVAILAITEIITGIVCLVGVGSYLLYGNSMWLHFGLMLSVVSLLMLFFGQRLAKDYEGAKTIAIYFGVALISFMSLAHS